MIVVFRVLFFPVLFKKTTSGRFIFSKKIILDYPSNAWATNYRSGILLSGGCTPSFFAVSKSVFEKKVEVPWVQKLRLQHSTASLQCAGKNFFKKIDPALGTKNRPKTHHCINTITSFITQSFIYHADHQKFLFPDRSRICCPLLHLQQCHRSDRSICRNR